MTYAVESVTYSDGPGLAETMMRAMNQDPHYTLLLGGATTDELIADTTLRIQHNLRNNHSRLRHQKVVHEETGQLVGYARWELPETEGLEVAWLDTQIPAATEAQAKLFKETFESTQVDGKRKIMNREMSGYLGPRLGKPYDDLVESGGPYLVLDYMAVHPAHQRKGVASMLLERGESEARKLGLKVFVMTATDPSGTKFYESRGFKNLLTVTLDDSKWGGTTPHVTSFLEKEV